MKNLLFGNSTSVISPLLKKKEIFPSLACLRIELLIHDGLAQRTRTRLLSNLTNLTSYDYPALGHLTVSHKYVNNLSLISFIFS